jgi:hypothetical protein
MFPAALEALEHLGDSLERIITPGSTDYAGRSKALPYEKALPYVRKAYTNLIGAKSRQEALRAMQHLSSYLDGICDGWYQRIVTLINAVNIDDTNVMASQSKEDHTMVLKTKALARLQTLAANVPARFKTGVKNQTISNPGFSPNYSIYSGKPEGFDFGAQEKNFLNIKKWLAAQGKKITYVGVSKVNDENSIRQRVSFVAVDNLTAPTVVWQKYDVEGGGKNVVCYGGKEIPLSKLMGQFVLINAYPALVKTLSENGIYYAVDSLGGKYQYQLRGVGPEKTALLRKLTKGLPGLKVFELNEDDDPADDPVYFRFYLPK